MKRIFYFIFLSIIVLLGILFAVLNAEPVRFDYYFGTQQAPLSLVVVLALAVGACLGVAASLGLLIRSRREAARLRRSAYLAEKEVMNLRSIPIRDKH